MVDFGFWILDWRLVTGIGDWRFPTCYNALYLHDYSSSKQVHAVENPTSRIENRIRIRYVQSKIKNPKSQMYRAFNEEVPLCNLKQKHTF